ncbi:MAG: sn-glycerol-3-phosphate ABC transporter ATP-binding protein UgpC [Alphaproteobacteria bacterium]|nr:sn-glycerol-3-phosphate ABC transporter ATP-binding protein UgpC [Alphaproteobacteria bacterium]MDA7988709.1 sn-glycerol-3-phosphate ABC transporter ATP-binding protein UgpC [Alphaproteobacteria bacterium]MDA7999920.1 sn-glycerol-3-phosphate ABC transporter ATP-binding protein UgpC [Alphaproteobacteria bacterium]MDA8003676.1 sn-glycerol-3-phosphate ABC transporter ATP-binding protein UgpC [Alphaproteobacteria bacterium]MDA8004995.1 sn-glycerol-3-phosphate ABC transporter ATP-binding protein 
MTAVTLSGIVKRYGGLLAVAGVSLDIRDGEFVVLVGPSGCGKSTTLRMIAGLEEISEGEVLIGDRVVNALPPRERNVSMVFQNYALYPHMTVRENLGFSLKIAGADAATVAAAVDDAAAILALGDLLERRPAQLSGGQRQRVAMGRAIVRRPDVFLFDEPLSNLDAKLRSQMRVEIKKLHQKFGSTVVYVTHDQVEAMTLADRIVLMRDGVVVQVGTPLELFDFPADAFVATFIGSPPMNLVDGVVGEGDGGGEVIFADSSRLPVPVSARGGVSAGRRVLFGFRADSLMPRGHSVREEGDVVSLRLAVNLTEPLGTETLLFTEVGGAEVQGKMFNPRPVVAGEVLDFCLLLDRCHLFDAETSAAIRV